MSLKIGDKVRVFDSARMSKGAASRPAKVIDLKWNLIQVHYQDGECECDWVDCRLIRLEGTL